MSSNKKYEALDGLRVFACIGVVLYHVRSNMNFEPGDEVFPRLLSLSPTLVLLFMTISAFGMCCGYYERFINKQIDITDFYKKRYSKILPFFALLCFIDLAVSPSLNSLYEVFANLTLCFGLIPNANITVIGVGWFLGTVFAFYLLFPFFVFLLSDKKRAWLAFVASYIMNYLCESYFDVGRTSIAYSFVYFMVGGMVYLYRNEIQDNKVVKYVSLAGFLLSMLCYCTIYDGNFIKVLFIAFALMFAINLSGKNLFNNKATKFISGISFEIYLCHMLIYRVVEKLHIARFAGNGYLNYFVTFFLVFVGAMIFAYVGKMCVEKLMNLFIKRRL